jgi:hypothetical protein
MSGHNQGMPGLAQYVPASPADWPVLPRTVQEALDLLAAGGSAGSGSAGLIYRPGGTTVGNVLATAAEVKQAIADTNGAVTIYVDASVAPTPGTALWPDTGTGASIGATDCLGTVRMLAYGNNAVPGPGGNMILKVLDGASFTNLRGVGTGLTLQAECTTTSALVFTNESAFSLVGEFADQAAILTRLAGATVALCALAAADLAFYTENAFVENDQAGAVGTFHLTAAAELLWLASGNLEVETTGPIVTGVAGTTLDFVAVGTTTVTPDSALAWPAASFLGTLDNSIGYAETTFLFIPGQTATFPNQYVEGEQLRQAVNAIPGPKTILVDDTAAAAHFTAGEWKLDNCTLLGLESSPTEALILDVGMTITSSSLVIGNGLIVQNQATSTPWTPASFFLMAFGTGGGNVQCVAGAAPFLAVVAAASGSSIEMNYAASLGDGTHNVVTVAAGQTLGVNIIGTSNVESHALAGAGTYDANLDSSGTLSPTQPEVTGTITKNLLSLATQVAYTPATGANWNPPPTTAGGALDQLAAPNFQTNKGNAGTGTATVTTTTANIAKKKSGTVSVSGYISGAASGVGTITWQILRDGATVIATGSVTTAATALGFAAALSGIDTLPNTLNHTYSMTATITAGTIAVPANGCGVSALES